MAPISLEEMDAVKLMNRIDTKFVTNEQVLDQILEKAAECGYRVCEIDGVRVLGYDSLYYDTPDLEMYRIHRAGHMVRQKIRVRTYLISGITYLEIKKKNNKGRTKKDRIRVTAQDLKSTREGEGFIDEQSNYTLDAVTPACKTIFGRITLVNKEKTERITFDTALLFKNPRTGKDVGLKDAVIIEVKQDGRIPSTMQKILLDLRVHPFKVSKYCIGTALTNPEALPGRFKVKIRRIEKIIGNKLND